MKQIQRYYHLISLPESNFICTITIRNANPYVIPHTIFRMEKPSGTHHHLHFILEIDATVQDLRGSRVTS